MHNDWQYGGFGLYVHWPFCQAKCPYCDFNSHVAARIDHASWLDAYLSEIDRVSRETKGRSLTSIFFGGGTPSLMEPATVGALLDHVARLWTIDDGAQITLDEDSQLELAPWSNRVYVKEKNE